ncbi:two-component regulator propeller domain-containing protein [Flammeovirgaceae bacterium SG7u.111]|nr:two-component regulator propeller domain-containing protein [Flammeovirgaceae bacterium SG7u.132]WPO34933.1 two-component regulator propeller domain-containing protein [Flammeovirgaceae bacterium SG7u.111]
MIRRYFIIWTILLVSSDYLYGIQNPIFNQLGVAEGLSDPMVNDIHQDEDGFIWVCTSNGLNRYDGYNMKTFFHIPNDSTSLVNSTVNCIDSDNADDLWLGTGQGFSKYSRESGAFTSFILEGSEQLNFIRAIFIKSDSVIWLGSNEGLIKFNPLDGSYKKYQQGTATSQSISHNIVRAITKDSNGHLWIGTFDGLNEFDPVSETFRHYYPVVRKDFDPINNLVISLHRGEDPDMLWVGMQTGLAKFNLVTKQFKVFRKELGYDGIFNNTIKSIESPSSNQLWVGTDEGLSIFDIDEEKFTTYRHNPFLSNSLSNDVVIDIYKDRSGLVWCGTNNGLSSYNLNRKRFDLYPIAKIDQSGAATGTEVTAIYKQENVGLWLGGSSGLIKIDTEGNEQWYTQQMDIGLGSNIIGEIYSDHSNNLWVSTTGGLSLYDPEKNNFLYFDIQTDFRVSKYVSSILEYEPDKYLVGSSGKGLLKFDINSSDLLDGKVSNPDFIFLKDIQVNDIIRGKEDDVWIIGGFGEVYKYSIGSGSITQYMLASESIEKNVVNIVCLYPNSNGQIWIGTRHGAYKLNSKSDHFEKVSELENIDIYSIEEDIKTGRLWISSTNSIIELDEEDKIAKRYMVGTDLAIKRFVKNSSFRDEQGIIYFGGLDGYISFDPIEIHEDKYVSAPLVTKITINNNELSAKDEFNGRRLTNKVVHLTDELGLRYSENSIEFTFSAFHFASPKSNQFAYRLNGFDDEWRMTDGAYPKALYSNLKSGDYIFSLKAANSDGIWSDVTRIIKVHIDTPWWASTTAFISYILTLIMVGGLATRQTIIRTKLKNEIKFEQLQHERDEELHQLKMEFFTNISHEIRTPLTLILGPVDQMIQRLSDKVVLGQLKMMKRNASRLLRLVNQILDMRELEQGGLELRLQNGDMVKMVEDIYTYFIELAKAESVSYSFVTNYKELLCQFDKDKIDKILFNLITNAFKYSGRNGKVEVKLSYPIQEQGTEYIEISVTDSGKGIPEDQLEHIFERFYHVEGLDNNIQKGTGIGLSMSSDYAKLHEGKILVHSTLGKGSVFRVLIPLLAVESVANGKAAMVEQPFVKEQMLETIEPKADPPNSTLGKGHPLLLVVEDNHDMRKFLCDNLVTRYQIMEAENGKQGFELAREHNPVLIISDIMMPVMNGLEFCHKIKSEFDTSHIPVILLTAKNSPENVLDGLEEGADDYITKPFFTKHLLARVENLINSRKLLSEKFNKGTLINPSDITATGIDENFISEVTDIIEAHISDSDLKVTFLAKSMGMSHSALYKKIKSITGLSGNEFIRNIRLKKASQLLKGSSSNITDVIYQVGFNNRSYFSKCFQEMYGMTPSQFAAQK